MPEEGSPSSGDSRGESAIADVFREAYGQAVATLVRVFGDITLAEDAVQDAFAIASDRWHEQIPPNPAGWIVTTARRRAIDSLRRSTRGRELHEELGRTAATYPDDDQENWTDSDPVPDDQLRLMFTCCHPALRREHQVALTLRLLGGLSVDEIARAFLVSEAAMAKRLVRAKYKIRAAKIPYRVPAESDLPDRLRPVLSVIYLIYNAGADDPGRTALRDEAIRLGRELAELMPDEPEAVGLLALLLLSESRMPARFDDGSIVLLRDQDRTRWDAEMIDEGHRLVRACVRRGRPGPYQYQAAIQAVHCDADSFAATDWQQIAVIYDQLLAAMPTPIVALNRAIAIGEAAGPEVALDELSKVSNDLDNYHLFHAARGATLLRLGRSSAALAAYRRASDLAVTAADRQFLAQQISDLVDSGTTNA